MKKLTQQFKNRGIAKDLKLVDGVYSFENNLSKTRFFFKATEEETPEYFERELIHDFKIEDIKKNKYVVLRDNDLYIVSSVEQNGCLLKCAVTQDAETRDHYCHSKKCL